MRVYVLITSDERSEVISGIFSSRDKLVSALSTTFCAEHLSRVETWEIDNGFVEFLNVTKKTTITIED